VQSDSESGLAVQPTINSLVAAWKMSTDPEDGSYREQLQFAKAIIAAFEQFMSNTGFHRVATTLVWVRYESAEMFLNVYHGRVSYEIDVEVGRRNVDRGYRYSLDDVLITLLGENHGQPTCLQASSASAVAACVDVAAGLVQRYYLPILRNDEGAWQRLEESTSQRNEAYTQAIVQEPVRKAADAAWDAKEYVRAAELYESIGDGLNPVERKRLEYVRRHSTAPPHGPKNVNGA
jgi:hypothetical protein